MYNYIYIYNLYHKPPLTLVVKQLSYLGALQRVAKVVPRLVRIVENSFGALDFEKSCLFVKRIGNA